MKRRRLLLIEAPVGSAIWEIMMPRYHLNIQGGRQTANDDVGVDMPSLEDARQAALSLIRNAGRASAASLYPVKAVVITDEQGKELLTVGGSSG